MMAREFCMLTIPGRFQLEFTRTPAGVTVSLYAPGRDRSGHGWVYVCHQEVSGDEERRLRALLEPPLVQHEVRQRVTETR